MKRLYTPEEINNALALVDAWKNPNLPERQWEVIKNERSLVYQNRALEVAPYRAALSALGYARLTNSPDIKLLDIGAGSGIYSEIFRRSGFEWSYTACDYSEAFKEFSQTKYPELTYDVQDATKLTYQDGEFDFVFHGCCLIHIKDWQKAIAEAARVSKHYVLFHRTPLVKEPENQYWLKEAYGVPCFDIWFSQDKFEKELMKNGLRIVYEETVFVTNQSDGYGHFSILCEKTL